MSSEKITIINEGLLSTIDGMTVGELISFFTEVKEDHGDDVILDYYYDGHNEIDIRLITKRERNEEEKLEEKIQQLKDNITIGKARRSVFEKGISDCKNSIKHLDSEIATLENMLKELEG